MALRTISDAGGSWDNTNTWVEGQIPTSSDDVVATATSGSLAINAAASCKSIDFTNYAGTLTHTTGATLTVAGNVTFVPGMTYAPSTNTQAIAITGACSLATAGKKIGNLSINGSGITVTLQDDLSLRSSSSTLTLTQGTLDANDFDVTVGKLGASGSATRAINMGSGTWRIRSTGSPSGPTNIWDATGSNITVNCETSIVRLTSLTDHEKVFAGGGKTYYAFVADGDNVIIADDNTFRSIKIYNPGTANGFKITSGSTQTITFELITSGTEGNLADLSSTTPGSAHNLAKASGIISIDYIRIKDSAAGGGATWDANNSVDVSGNSGWNFFTIPAEIKNGLWGTKAWGTTVWGKGETGAAAYYSFATAAIKRIELSKCEIYIGANISTPIDANQVVREDVCYRPKFSDANIGGFETFSCLVKGKKPGRYDEIIIRDGVKTLWEGFVDLEPRETDKKEVYEVKGLGWFACGKRQRLKKLYSDGRYSSWQNTRPDYSSLTEEQKAQYLSAKYVVKPDNNTKNINELRIHTQGDLKYPAGYENAWTYFPPAGLTIKKLTFDYDCVLTTNLYFSVWYYKNSSWTSLEDITASGSGSKTYSSIPDAEAVMVQLKRLNTELDTTGIADGTYYIKITNPLIFGSIIDSKASGVIEDTITNNVPELSSDFSEIQDSVDVIEPLVFESLVTPQNIWDEANKHHLWNMGVWDNKGMHYQPHDTDTVDYVVNAEDVDDNRSVAQLVDIANYVIVRYKDSNDKEKTVTVNNVTSRPDLAPNKKGLVIYADPLDIETTDESIATAAGQAKLDDLASGTKAGQVTVKGKAYNTRGQEVSYFYIRSAKNIKIIDRQGNSEISKIIKTEKDVDSHSVTLQIGEESQHRLDLLLANL